MKRVTNRRPSLYIKRLNGILGQLDGEVECESTKTRCQTETMMASAEQISPNSYLLFTARKTLLMIELA